MSNRGAGNMNLSSLDPGIQSTGIGNVGVDCINTPLSSLHYLLSSVCISHSDTALFIPKARYTIPH